MIMEEKTEKLGKRLLAVVLCFVLGTGCIWFPQKAQAAVTEEDYTYTIRVDNTAIIDSFNNGEAAVVRIPKYLGGVKVTEIGKNAFYNCTSLEKLTLL